MNIIYVSIHGWQNPIENSCEIWINYENGFHCTVVPLTHLSIENEKKISKIEIAIQSDSIRTNERSL